VIRVFVRLPRLSVLDKACLNPSSNEIMCCAPSSCEVNRVDVAPQWSRLGATYSSCGLAVPGRHLTKNQLKKESSLSGVNILAAYDHWMFAELTNVITMEAGFKTRVNCNFNRLLNNVTVPEEASAA
jgi:hypothetical protein